MFEDCLRHIFFASPKWKPLNYLYNSLGICVREISFTERRTRIIRANAFCECLRQCQRTGENHCTHIRSSKNNSRQRKLGLDIRILKMYWPRNPSQRSFKVTGTDTDRSASFDFLLTLHSNHEPISYRFRDKRPFQSKIANFPTPVYLTPPLKGFPLELGTDARG